MRAFWVLGGVGVGALAVWGFVSSSSPAILVSDRREVRAGGEGACASGLEYREGACFALPALPPTGLVVYLHGLYAPATVREEWARQERVARVATSRRFAVVALRGRQGACVGEERAAFWCWPSQEKTADQGPAVVESWSRTLGETEQRVGKVPRFLLGFSNGGYFAGLIAVRALLPVDAVAVAHAGPVLPVRAAGAKPPILLLTANQDISVTSMMAFDGELTREGWPHLLTSREGGHDLTTQDIETALTFFSRAGGGKWPLSPPLATVKPVPDLPGSPEPKESPPAPSEEDDSPGEATE